MAHRTGPVIVGVDGSPASQQATVYAARSAATHRRPLLLVSTYTLPTGTMGGGLLPPQPTHQQMQTECRSILEQAQTTARQAAPEVEISHVVIEGNTSRVLLDYSTTAALIVVGSRGLGGLTGMVLGSVSANLASHAACPVVVTGDGTGDLAQSGPVVVGIDGSPVSTAATDQAFAEAAARSCPLLAVHTWIDPQVQLAASGLSLSHDQWDQLQTRQQAWLAEQLAGFCQRYPDVPVERVLSPDPAAHALTAHAHNAQLLVVGSRGRGGFAGMVLGSTSRALLQTAPCPVMIVRPHP